MSNKWINLDNNIVIVTGGSMGIGKKIVENLVSNGAKVISADVAEHSNIDHLDNVECIKCDVSNKKDIENLIDKVVDKYGKIDALINNAGVSRPRLLVDYLGEHPEYELSEDDFDFMTNVNQKGVFLCSQATARIMIKQKNGIIVNMTSKAGLEGSEGQSCYSANKAAVHAFTQAWAKELGKFNIRVVGVMPSINERTPMNSDENFKALAYARGTDPGNVHTDYKGMIPLQRPGKLYEIADLISYLISNHSSYITGTSINITGGNSTL